MKPVSLNSKKQLIPLGILFCAMAAVFFRQPTLFTEPRFWAEEGSRFFSYAYNHTWYESILQTQGGYFTLWPNIASTIAANLVPLLHAPLITTMAAFIVILTPISIILWSSSSLWNTKNRHLYFPKKIIAIAIILFAPFSDEVWLNTICSQFYFSLITLLILTEDSTPHSRKNWFYRILLCFSGLTGVLSCLLTPFFFIKWFNNKEKENFIRLAILLTCIAIQIIVAINFPHTNAKAHESRFIPMDYSLFASIAFTRTISPIIFGFDSTSILTNILFALRNNILVFRSVSNVFILSEVLLLLFLFFSPKNRSYKAYIIGSYLVIFIISAGLSVGSKFAQLHQGANTRYYYVPTALMMFLFLFNIHFVKNELSTNIRGALCAIFLTISIFYGFSEYRHSHSYFAEINELKKIKWEKEISLWEKDNSYLINIWPQGWKMGL